MPAQNSCYLNLFIVLFHKEGPLSPRGKTGIMQMKTIVIIHLSLVLLALFVFIAGLLLPRRKEACRIVELNDEPEEIWAFVTNIGRLPRWRSNLKDVKVLKHTPELEMWIEYPKKGAPLTFKTRKKIPYTLYEVELVNSGLVEGHRTTQFKELGRETTQVMVTESAEIQNPFKRVLAHLYVDLNADIDQYVKDLTAELARQQERLESQTS